MTDRVLAPVLALAECALLLRSYDDVAVTTQDLLAGTRVLTATTEIVVLGGVPRGHKLAVRDVPAGSAVHKYGQSIGLATVDIAAGEHVHLHNLGMDSGARAYQFGTARTVLPAPPGPPRTFQGYHRANGRVGTRNYVGVLASVNCSASSAKMVADQFRGMALDAFPNVDGVIALTHQSDHSVDVREGVERHPPKLVGNHLRRRRRAVHRGQHPDVVAGADTTVRTVITLEGSGRARRRGENGPGGAELVGARATVHPEVVQMNVLAGGDVDRREADRLTVLVHRRPRRHVANGKLVTARHTT